MLYCYNNQLTSLDVSKNTALTELYCSENSQLTSLDVSQNTALKTLGCDGNQIKSLDVSKNTALTALCCSDNSLTSLDVRKNTALKYLSCHSNQLTSLDVSQNTALTQLSCSYNRLTSLDVSRCTALEYLDCYKKPFIAVNAAGSISNFIASPLLQFTAKSPVIRLADYGIKEDMISDLMGGTIEKGYLLVDGTATYTYDIDGELGTNTISCTINASGIAINETNFPDENFRNFVQAFDTVDDDTLSGTEIAAVTEIIVSRKKISNLKGIEYFTALETLECGYNSLTTLDVSKNTALKTLKCLSNQLTILDVSQNTALEYLDCLSNQLTSLDVRKNTALTYLDCYDNQLTSLDVRKNKALTELYCFSNQLTSLDVRQNTALTGLYCENNQLTSLDVSKNTALTKLNCSENEYQIKLTGSTFDMSTLPEGFDITKASEWTNAKVQGNILTVTDPTQAVTYKYALGNNSTEIFTLVPVSAELTEDMISEIEAQTYTGSEIKPEMTVSCGGKVLTEGEDYTVSYEDNINKGTAKVIVKAAGDFYTGEATADFEINPLDIENAVITLAEPKLVYNGEAQTQAIESVKINDLILTADDYTISGNTGTNADTYTLTIMGVGNFTGTATADFEISPLDIEDAEITLAETKLVYNGEAQTQEIESVKINDLILTADDYTISDNNGTNADSYTLTITGVGNFTGTATADFEISPLDIEDAEITLRSWCGTRFGR